MKKLLSTLLVLLCLPSRSAVEAARPYLKSGTSPGGTLELRIACRKFVSTNHTATTVWLTGVSHLGSSNYYAKLQTHLEAMDVVLYEGVGDPQSAKGGGELSDGLQGGLARALGLRFQLEAIDYSRANFVNSDLTLEELMTVIRRSKDPEQTLRDLQQLMASMQAGSILSRVMNGLGHMLENSPKTRAFVLAGLIEALGSLRGDITEMKGTPPAMQRLMKALVDERNKAVLADLKALIAKEKPPASVSVFYGAAHMHDFEERLTAELGYRPAGDLWLTAIRLKPADYGLTLADLRLVRSLIRAQMNASMPFSAETQPAGRAPDSAPRP